MIWNLLISFSGTFLLTLFEIISWFNISRIGLIKFRKKNVLMSLSLILIVFLIHNFGNDFFNGFVILIFAVIYCKILTALSLKNSIILSFISQLCIIVSEGIIVIFLIYILKINTKYISDTPLAGLLLDVLVSIMCYAISKLKVLNIIYNFFVKITNYIKIKQLVILIFFVALGSNIFTTSVYFNDNMLFKLILNIIVSLIYTIIIVLVINYQSKYYKINSMYKMSIDDLQSKEKLIDEYRIITHENKNQLETIKLMTKSKKINSYINSLIKKNSKIKKNTIFQSLKLPQGGIRGLVYSKILLMDEKNIEYHLNVDTKINHKKLLKITYDDTVDICKILGVFLDNAIEESEKLTNPIININLYLDEIYLNITISNKIAIDNVLNNGTVNLKSSKGKNRGYGLQLAKRIIAQNKKIENYREICRDTFTQVLRINYIK